MNHQTKPKPSPRGALGPVHSTDSELRAPHQAAASGGEEHPVARGFAGA